MLFFLTENSNHPEKALLLLEDGNKIVLGDKHPNTLQALQNLAMLLKEIKDYHQAIEYYKILIDL